MGWYAMALVDVLDDLPAGHPKRSELIGLLKDFADAIVEYRDGKTHLWYQVVDQGDRQGNYLESSASCMFCYCLAKGSAKGYLDGKYAAIAKETFEGIIRYQVTADSGGAVDLRGTCASAGLGGTPHRDGSYEYYTHIPQVTNDPRGLGPFLLAAIEVEAGGNGGTQQGSGKLDPPPPAGGGGRHPW